MDNLIILLLIFIPELLVGFYTGVKVIKQKENKIVWQTINRGQEVSARISNNNTLTLVVLTAIGIFSVLIYYVAKKRYSQT